MLVSSEIKTKLLAFNEAGISLSARRGCSADLAVGCGLGENQPRAGAGLEQKHPGVPPAALAAWTDGRSLSDQGLQFVP